MLNADEYGILLLQAANAQENGVSGEHHGRYARVRAVSRHLATDCALGKDRAVLDQPTSVAGVSSARDPIPFAIKGCEAVQRAGTDAKVVEVDC